MIEILDIIKEYTGIPNELQVRLFKTMLTGLVLYFLSKVAQRISHKYIQDKKKQYRSRKIIKRTSFIIFLFLITDLWLVKFNSLATFFGLFSAGLAIALKDPITDIAGWLFIIWRKPFDISDRVEVGAHKGDVIDIRLFQFTLIEIGNWVGADQSTGRVIHIPNASVFNNNLANYTAGFQYIWDEIEVVVTFESDWKKAKSIVEEVLNKNTSSIVDKARQEMNDASKKYLILYNNLTPKVYTSVNERGIALTGRYLIASKQRRTMNELIWEDILDQFSLNDTINYAYPSIRYYDNRLEGKKPMRAD